jgi:uncharacterized membrane protein YeaQ/YmgE (transglycosylase-associated protein family)
VGGFFAGLLGIGQGLTMAFVFAVLGSILLLLVYRMVRLKIRT